MTWPDAGRDFHGPLAGLRVLDLSRILAGPYAGMLLGDLGADVIKVERPDGGDETRRWGPPFVHGTAAYFFTANRNRRSVTLDLKDESDQEVARAIAADADVLLENFLPGATDRLGVDYERLRLANPRIVYCTISGYGAGDRSSWPALDFVIQAHAGIMSLTGESGGEPVKAGAPIADMATGLFATVGLLAALAQARATGHGAHVEVSLADACTCLLANQAMNHLLGGDDPRAAGNTHPNIAPYQTVAARDRPIAIAATSDLQFRRLCAVVERLDLAADPRFGTNAGRVEHRDELVAALDSALAGDDASSWVARLNEAGVAAATINSVAELLSDPDTAARLVTSVPAEGGPVAQLRSPIRIDGAALEPQSGPPALGAHTAAIRSAVAAPKEVSLDA